MIQLTQNPGYEQLTSSISIVFVLKVYTLLRNTLSFLLFCLTLLPIFAMVSLASGHNWGRYLSHFDNKVIINDMFKLYITFGSQFCQQQPLATLYTCNFVCNKSSNSMYNRCTMYSKI